MNCIPGNNYYDSQDTWRFNPPGGSLSTLWNCRCPQCGITHGKQWNIESDLCSKCKKELCTIETDGKQRTVIR